MAYTTTISTSVAGFDTSFSSTRTLTGAAKLSIDEVLPTGHKSKVDLNFNTGSDYVLAMKSNISSYPITVETNESGNGTNTFTFNSAAAIILSDFTKDRDSIGQSVQDITGQIFVNNTGSSLLTFELAALRDPTP